MQALLSSTQNNVCQQKVLCNWGLTLKQSSAVHIQALVSADGILPGISFKLQLLFINLASVPGRQLVNSPTAQSLERCMPFLMTIPFIEKYALTLEPYSKIKADLGLTTDEFYALTKALASEIEIARKVRQLYQRKGFKKIGLLDFYHWWAKQEKICKYCGIDEQQLSILFDKLKEFNKRPTRGKTLELDRRISNKDYDDIDNLVLCCYICNNAKSDFFNHEQFIPVGQSIKLVWTKILNPE